MRPPLPYHPPYVAASPKFFRDLRPFTSASFRRQSVTGYYVWFVLIFVRRYAGPIRRVEVGASGPPKGRALVYRPVDDEPAFRVSTEGGSERARAAPGPRSTASRLRVRLAPAVPTTRITNTLRRAIGQQSRPIGLLRASRYALHGWPWPRSVAVFRSRLWTSKVASFECLPPGSLHGRCPTASTASRPASLSCLTAGFAVGFPS